MTRVEVNGGGLLVNNSAAVTVIVGAGSYYRHELGTATTIRVQAGGVCKYNSNSTATLVIVEPGGIFDGRDNAPALATPTTTITTLEAYPGSSVYLNSGFANWRVTTDKNCGGNVVAQPGYTTAI